MTMQHSLLHSSCCLFDDRVESARVGKYQSKRSKEVPGLAQARQLAINLRKTRGLPTVM